MLRPLQPLKLALVVPALDRRDIMRSHRLTILGAETRWSAPIVRRKLQNKHALRAEAVRKTMNAKKRKTKERRRARRLADQAWDAVDNENLDLAEKLIRRAVATQCDNPVLWHDHGIILCLCGNESEAEQSFRATLSLAPDFADAYARLAALHVRRGQLTDAVALQEQAVVHAPELTEHRKRLKSYRSLAGQAETKQLMQHQNS